MPPCGLLIQKFLEIGDGTPDEDASHERNCFRISMPKLQPDSVLASSYVSGCTFAVRPHDQGIQEHCGSYATQITSEPDSVTEQECTCDTDLQHLWHVV